MNGGLCLKRVHEGRSKKARVMEKVPSGESERIMNARTLYRTCVASVRHGIEQVGKHQTPKPSNGGGAGDDSIPVAEGVLGEEGQRVVQIGKCHASRNDHSG